MNAGHQPPILVDDVLITQELALRPSRPPDYQAENQAMTALARKMASDPSEVLQKVAELGMELCRADSAGISILEPGGVNGIFRWSAIAGTFAANRYGSTPREAGPCGTVISRNQILLFNNAERFFPSQRGIEPHIYEHMLVPWHVNGEAVGTLWVLSHDPQRRFDAEDARLLGSLGRFTSAAHQMISALQEAKGAREELEQRVADRTRDLAGAYEAICSLETRNGLLLRLLRAQRETVDPEVIMHAAAEAIGHHLNVDRVGFFDISEDHTLTFTNSWVEGRLPALTGAFPASMWDARHPFLADVRLGRVLTIEDVSSDPLTVDSILGALGVHSLIAVPIVRFGRWHAGLYVNHADPRKWTADDVALVREVADQTWDAVERARAQRALSISEERLRLALESAGQSTWFYDPVRKLIVGDEELQKVFGMASQEGPLEEWLARIHPDDQNRVRAEFTAAITSVHPFETEYRIAGSDGIRWRRSRARQVNSKEIPARLVGICEDVTSRKRSEAALRQTEKLAAVGRLASSIAHEINNPLESVTNLLYLARMTEDTSAVRSYLETADQELRRASAITSQTLRFHKQSSGPTAISCEELFASTLAIYQGRLNNCRLRLEKRKRARRLIVCYEGEIRQVLSNLIGNAIDAMHPEGGRLILRSREGTDWKTGRTCLILTVADTGSGMSRETIKRIFEPFFTTKGIGGTGLGLWVSQEIIGRHHGRLAVRSRQQRPDAGTVFCLFLPFDATTCP